MHAGGGFLGHALDIRQDFRIPARLFFQAAANRGEQHLLFFTSGVGDQRTILFRPAAQRHQQRGVAAVVEDHVAHAALAAELEDLVGVFPVFDQRLALDGEDRRAGGGDGRGGVVLGREDVARGPAHFGTQGFQRLDQHGGLDSHMQGAGDAGPFQGLAGPIFVTQSHQARHLGLGDGDLLVAPVGKRDVADDVVGHAEWLRRRN